MVDRVLVRVANMTTLELNYDTAHYNNPIHAILWVIEINIKKKKNVISSVEERAFEGEWWGGGVR